MRRKLPRFTPVNSAQESKALVENDRPSIIIASSGMATGGRVVHHLFAGLPDPRNTVLFVGFQAAGTRGRQLIDGAQHVKIFGQHVPVHARIEKIDGMSSHADAGEIIRWLRTFPRAPKMTYLVHGEIVAQDALRLRIAKELGWPVQVPAHGEKVDVASSDDADEIRPTPVARRHRPRGRICSSRSTMRPSCSCMRTASRSCR